MKHVVYSRTIEKLLVLILFYSFNHGGGPQARRVHVTKWQSFSIYRCVYTLFEEEARWCPWPAWPRFSCNFQCDLSEMHSKHASCLYPHNGMLIEIGMSLTIRLNSHLPVSERAATCTESVRFAMPFRKALQMLLSLCLYNGNWGVINDQAAFTSVRFWTRGNPYRKGALCCALSLHRHNSKARAMHAATLFWNAWQVTHFLCMLPLISKDTDVNAAWQP